MRKSSVQQIEQVAQPSDKSHLKRKALVDLTNANNVNNQSKGKKVETKRPRKGKETQVPELEFQVTLPEKPIERADVIPTPSLPPRDRLSLGSLEPMLIGMRIASPMAIQPTFEDIDTPDLSDPQAVAPYAQSIFEHLKKKELVDRINPKYMSRQVDINDKMRSMLIDWMVEVHLKFKMLTETLFLSLNILDRFLCAKQCPRSKLQLISITAMLIASKYEEVYQPSIDDFIFISDSQYNKNDVLRAEEIVLQALKYNLCNPTVPHFLRRYSKASRSNTKMHSLAKYFAELSMLDTVMLQYQPSNIAAASVMLSRLYTGSPAWSTTLEHYTGYSEAGVIACARDLYSVLRKYGKPGTECEAIYTKYSSAKLNSVATLPELSKPLPGF